MDLSQHLGEPPNGRTTMKEPIDDGEPSEAWHPGLSFDSARQQRPPGLLFAAHQRIESPLSERSAQHPACTLGAYAAKAGRQAKSVLPAPFAEIPARGSSLPRLKVRKSRVWIVV